MNHMKKLITLSAFLFTISTTWSQQLLESNPDLKAMVETERDFARMAKYKNTRDAFLTYLTEDVITTSQNGPVKGKEEIKNQKVGEGWLYWNVAFSDISASGDFGYNTGPWEFRANRSEEKPIGYGEFNSIWKKQANGSWKNVLDIGIQHSEGPSVESIKFASTSMPLSMVNNQNKSTQENEVKQIEGNFLTLANTDRHLAYDKYLSAESRIVHSGQLPIISTEAKREFLADNELLSKVIMIDGEVSSSNDLGYVYGKATIEVPVKGKIENKIATYFRVWKKEDGINWKIVLDVLSYK